MRFHHSQSGYEDSRQPKNIGSLGITGSHGSRGTNWGEKAAGTFSRFLDAAGSMPGARVCPRREGDAVGFSRKAPRLAQEMM